MTLEIKSEEPGVIQTLEEEVQEFLNAGLIAEQIAEKVQLDLQIVQSVIESLKR